MNENYLMLNGKRVDLTDEQIRQLGFDPRKDCFEYAERAEYYCVTTWGNVSYQDGRDVNFSEKCYSSANYCTDKQLMRQRALHEVLDRLLWRFSMQNDGDKIDWDDIKKEKYYIIFNHNEHMIHVECFNYFNPQTTFFYSKEIAKRAIDEIVLPFMNEHPEFVW